MKKIQLRILFCISLFFLGSILAKASVKSSPNAEQGEQVKDTIFVEPYIDLDEWREQPVKHRYVHGGFKGTDLRFSYYFPAPEKYKGRFFQYITPVPDSEYLSQGAQGEEDRIGFSLSSGAYFIETNGGGTDATASAGKQVNPEIGGFLANAAAARYSRQVAREMYGGNRPYGYCFGGSGGSLRTIGGMENTKGVWDGAVPFVTASNMAMPSAFTVRVQAMRVLKDKFPQILDAVEPGGSGDMYAGLNEEEHKALEEAYHMGFPVKSFYDYKTMGIHAFAALYGGMVISDRLYFKDFWEVPGYEGANPTKSLLESRIQHKTFIKKVITAEEAMEIGLDIGREPGEKKGKGKKKSDGSADLAWQSLDEKEKNMPVAFQLNKAVPVNPEDYLGGDIVMKSGSARRKSIFVKEIKDDYVILGQADEKVLKKVHAGDQVVVDNSNFLAAQSYHRHCVPEDLNEYPAWRQFCDKDGNPLYPQRPMLLGPMFSSFASGKLITGEFNGKMIIVENLWDKEAYAWQADWYYNNAKKFYGDDIDNRLVVWYNDHTLHGDFTEQKDPTRTVSYLGILQQALRDLSLWVEKGVAPPSTTGHIIEDCQVIVPDNATERKGIQPVVNVKANGCERADVKVGDKVTFEATIEVPPHAGKIIAAEWDFDEKGIFPVAEKIKKGKLSEDGTKMTIIRTYTFDKPGTYFPALRGVSQREGDQETPYARIQNLGRVRVVVQ